MEDLLTQLGTRYGVQVARAGDGWKLDLPIRGAFACSLSIGPDALDWAANIREAASGREVFTDWNDYLNYDNTPIPELLREKRQDIEWFVGRWNAASSVRVIFKKHLFGLLTKQLVQWQHDGEWYGIILGDPERPTE